MAVVPYPTPGDRHRSQRELRLARSVHEGFPKGIPGFTERVSPNGGDVLRQVLDRLVQTKEAWAAALTGGSMPLMDNAPAADRTPAAMLARLDKADADFHGVLTDVRNRSAWEDTFVDALCELPETFTFGGMFAHVITFNPYRRMMAMDAMRRLGVKVEGFGCPMEYVASLAGS